MSTTARTSRHRSVTDADPAEWDQPERQPRDWKKMVLMTGLALLSWVATYVGMLELIEANMGELPLVHEAIIGFSVAMLMTMVVWLLDQIFSPIGLFTRALYTAGYLFLSVISVGFGFGFYWKVLESRSEASRSAEGAVGQVQGSLLAASTRLEQLQSTLVTLTQISTTKAQQETATGTSCPNSRPGDGPRRKLREDDAARFTFASEFVKGRVGQVKAEMSALDADFARITSNDASIIDAKSGTRNEFLKSLSRKLDNTVTGFNAFRSDPQLKQMRQELADRSDRTSFPDSKGGTFQCPDGQLASAIKGVVRAIDELPVLEKPKIAAVEGSEATIEAFRRLTATFAGLVAFKLPPSADELRELQKKAVQSVEQPSATRAAAADVQPGLSKRDYVPLAIAIFVDICLLLVSIGRPMNRMQGLVPKMREAEKGPVYQILSKFTDIHKDAETREKFELFRHVVFDFNGDYYVAVPLIAPYRQKPGAPTGYSTADIEALQLDAHMLANLFASFEKEKIFGRVYNPLLSTRKIQDKLWRQGSKFAYAGAFRVYRFRDGAWSDIILGAVMGAARRVETERRRRVRDELESGLGALASHGTPAGDDTSRAGTEPIGQSDRIELPARPHGEGAGGSQSEPRDHGAQFGPYAAFADPIATGDSSKSQRPLARILERARQPRLADFEADVSVNHPANNNTMPGNGAAREPVAKVTQLRKRQPLPSLRTLTDAADGITSRDRTESADRAGVRSTLREAPDRYLASRADERPPVVAAAAPAASPAAMLPHELPAAALSSVAQQAVSHQATLHQAAAQPAAVVSAPRIDVTLVERRATYSVPAGERPVTAGRSSLAEAIDMAASRPAREVVEAIPVEDERSTVKRLSDALSGMASSQWQSEQRAALKGDEPELLLEGRPVVTGEPQERDDATTRVAERFRPAAGIAGRARE